MIWYSLLLLYLAGRNTLFLLQPAGGNSFLLLYPAGGNSLLYFTQQVETDWSYFYLQEGNKPMHTHLIKALQPAVRLPGT